MSSAQTAHGHLNSGLRIADFLMKRSSQIELRGEFLVGPDERLVIQGPSGCGKSTLLRWIAGLEQAAGKIWVDGRLISSLKPEERGLGLVFQVPEIFPDLTVREQIGFGLRVGPSSRRVSSERFRELTNQWAERVGLTARIGAQALDQWADRLSGGERQRLALAQSLILEPRTLLLDEPFSALDSQSREELSDLLVRLHSEVKIPMVLVTHDEVDAVRVGTRRLELRLSEDGRQRVFGWNSGAQTP